MSSVILRLFAAFFAFMYPVSILHAQTSFRSLHEQCVVVDGHNDILMRVIGGESIEQLTSKGHSDLKRFRSGGIDVQGFSIWVPPKYNTGGEAYQFAVREIDSLDAIIARNAWSIEKTTSGDALLHTLNRNAMAAVYALEGCHPAENSLDRILAFYKRGVRMFGLTWNNSTVWAASSNDEQEKKQSGLSKDGVELIRLLDSLGALIDVSHSGERTFYDVLAATKNPIIASHSSCRALRNHHRNLTDDQLHALAANGGVVMINYCPAFIFAGIPGNAKELIAGYRTKLVAIEKKHGLDSKEYLRQRDALILKARNAGLPTILDVADHIQHAVQIAGSGHVGLGSDFDGIGYAPFGLDDVTQLPYLTRELQNRGLSDEDIRGILGGNFVRVFSQVCR